MVQIKVKEDDLTMEEENGIQCDVCIFTCHKSYHYNTFPIFFLI